MTRRIIRMADLQRAAREVSDAWMCPRCGAVNWKVTATWYALGQGIRRRRECRKCGQTAILTSERPDA